MPIDDEVLTASQRLELDNSVIEEDEETPEIDQEDPGTDNEPGEDSEFDYDSTEDDLKYELTTEVREYNGKILSRIRALKDFANVRIGQFGGFVENPYNLSQEGNCWIYDEAMVMDTADVRGDAQVRGEAIVCGEACICEKAKVLDQAWIGDETLVGGEAIVRDFAVVCGESFVRGNAQIYNGAFVRNATVNHYGCVKNYGIVIETDILDHAYVFDNAVVCADTSLDGAMTRIGHDTRLINADALATVMPDKSIVSGQFLRCSLSFLRCDYVLPDVDEEDGEDTEYEEEELPYMVRPDPDDANTYYVDVYPGYPLKLEPITVDPTARAHVVWEGVHVCDMPVLWYSDDAVGTTDTVTIKVTNPACHGSERAYTLYVNILETPEDLIPEEPEEPDEDLIDLSVLGFSFRTNREDPEIEGVRHMSDPHDPLIHFVLLPRESQLYIVPELVDDRAEWKVEFLETDITDGPLLCDGEVDEPIYVTIYDPNDEERFVQYEFNVAIGAEP